MTRVSPILIFAGKANQAIKLYEEAFRAKVKVKMLYSEVNSNDFKCKEEEKDFIYHSQIKIGEQLLMLADDSDGMLQGGEVGKAKNSYLVDLVVEFDTDDELKAAYEKLSIGATITNPLHSPEFCSLCVYLTDRFGARWQLMSYKG
jgi:PhnB protein